MKLGEWKSYLGEKFPSEKHGPCIAVRSKTKSGNNWLATLCGDTNQIFIKILRTLSFGLNYGPERVDILIYGIEVNWSSIPFSGLEKFLHKYYLGKVDVKNNEEGASGIPFDYLNAAFGNVEADRRIRKESFREPGAFPLSKPIRAAHGQTISGEVTLNLKSNDAKKIHRLYMAAAFTLLHDRARFEVGAWPENAKTWDGSIAAILVHESGKVLSYGLNKASTTTLFHAEIVAVENYFLHHKTTTLPKNCHLYTTMEPCHMCAGYLAYHASKTEGMVIYYGHTDHGADNSALDESGCVKSMKLHSGHNKPLREYKTSGHVTSLTHAHTSDDPGIVEKKSITKYLDDNVKWSLKKTLKQDKYKKLFAAGETFIRRKENKYNNGGITFVALALNEVHRFLAAVGRGVPPFELHGDAERNFDEVFGNYSSRLEEQELKEDIEMLLSLGEETNDDLTPRMDRPSKRKRWDSLEEDIELLPSLGEEEEDEPTPRLEPDQKRKRHDS